MDHITFSPLGLLFLEVSLPVCEEASGITRGTLEGGPPWVIPSRGWDTLMTENFFATEFYKVLEKRGWEWWGWKQKNVVSFLTKNMVTPSVNAPGDTKPSDTAGKGWVPYDVALPTHWCRIAFSLFCWFIVYVYSVRCTFISFCSVMMYYFITRYMEIVLLRIPNLQPNPRIFPSPSESESANLLRP